MEDSIIDLDAIMAEVDQEQANTPSVTEPVPTEDDIFLDLLSTIESQEIEQLGIEDTKKTGITTGEQAEFYIRRYKKLKDAVQHTNDAADKYINNVKIKAYTWRNSEVSKLENQMKYIQSMLESYARNNISGKKKSIKLIEGTIGFSKQQPKIDYDEDKLRKFLQSTKSGENYLEALEPKVKWGEFKKVANIDSSGIFRYGDDAVPGVVVTQRPDKFNIK